MIASAIVELGGPHPQAAAMREPLLAAPGALALLGSRVINNLLLPLLPAPRFLVLTSESSIVYRRFDSGLPIDILPHFSPGHRNFIVRRGDLHTYIAEHPDCVHSYIDGVACAPMEIVDLAACDIYAKIYSGVLHFVLILDRDAEYLPGNRGVPGQVYSLRELLYTSIFGGIVPIATLPCGLVFGCNYKTVTYGLSNGRHTIFVANFVNHADHLGIDDLGKITHLNYTAPLYEYTFQYAAINVV